MSQKPPTRVDLLWEGDLRFSGQAGDLQLMLDSNGVAGPSPMQYLGLALAGCMAVDLVHILRKGRHDLRSLKASLTGVRAPDEPRRFTSIELTFTVGGPVPPAQIERAIALSREKYCSVWNSMRQDIDFRVSYSTE
jgi:putative redox protein